MSTESTVKIKVLFKDELVFVVYRSVQFSSGLTCVYINSWPYVYSVVTCSKSSGKWGVYVFIHAFICGIL